MRNLLATTLLLVTAVPALAKMPPKNMDLGNESMTESQVFEVYRDHFGEKRMDKITFHRVKFGKAHRACDVAYRARYGQPYPLPPLARFKLYGCNFGDDNHAVIVYSYDPTGKDPHMATNVLRHELAHELFDWPANHPNALP